MKDDNFELKCEVTSSPPVVIEWFADGQKLVRQNSESDIRSFTVMTHSFHTDSVVSHLLIMTDTFL